MRLVRYLLVLCSLLLILSACGSGSSSGTSVPVGSPVSLGLLSNNSQIYLTQNNLPVSVATPATATIYIVNAKAGDVVNLNYTTTHYTVSHTSMSEPEVMVTPDNCTLTTSSTSCQVVISVKPEAAPGTYVITPTATINGGTAQTLSPITILVNNQVSNVSQNILYFLVGNTFGVINDNQINVVLPYGSNITNLVATYVMTGESVSINNVTQVNGTTANNFTQAVIYTVHAKDGSTKNYTVNVSIADESANNISGFSLNGYHGVIDGNNIEVNVPYGTNVTNLVATYTTDGESVSVSGVTQANQLTMNDFTTPVTYSVHAVNGSIQTYTVTVIVALNHAKEITSFSLNGTVGLINGDNISVTMPAWADLSDLIATYVITGESVTVNDVLQSSGETANDFTNPVVYTVHAANNTTRDYTVMVTESYPVFESFIMVGQSGIVNQITTAGYSNLAIPNANYSSLAINSSGRFVLAGSAGALISDDGINWSMVGGTTSLSAVITNSNDEFVAVGTGGAIYRSVDGTKWDKESSGVTAALSGVAVNNNGKYVAVGVFSTILSSDDGISWQVESSGLPPSPAVSLLGVAVNQAGDKFVAVGGRGTIITSSDAESWTARISGVPINITLRSVAASPDGIFVAAGNGNTILKSDDGGITWESRPSGLPSGTFNSVCYINSEFIIVGSNGVILTSTDGDSWTDQSMGGSVTLYAILMNNSGLWVTIGGNNAIFTSSDFTTWTNHSSPTITPTNLNGVTVNESGLFVIVGTYSTPNAPAVIFTSTDKVNWILQSSGTTNILASVAVNSDGLFVAAGNGDTILSSDDGITWTTRVSGNISDNLTAVTVSPSGLFVVTGVNGIVKTSTDGVNWSTQTSGVVGTNLNAVAVNESGYFIAVGANGTVITSPDGVNWTQHTSNTAQTLYGVAVSPSGVWVAVGQNGTIITSNDDGVTWVEHSFNTSSLLRSVSVNEEGIFVIVGDGGTVLISNDGVRFRNMLGSPLSGMGIYSVLGY